MPEQKTSVQQCTTMQCESPVRLQGFMGKVRRRARPIVVSKRLGSFLFIMYLFVKCLYILNAIGLLYILNWILGKQSPLSYFG